MPTVICHREVSGVKHDEIIHSVICLAISLYVNVTFESFEIDPHGHYIVPFYGLFDSQISLCNYPL